MTSNFGMFHLIWFNVSVSMVSHGLEIDVGSILEYARPRKAVMDHVPVKFKKPYKSLLDSIGRPEIGRQTQDYNELNAMFINEAGLYRLIMRSKTEKAEEFTDWVCSEVLPTIRKTGSYIPNQEGAKRFLLIDDTSKYAQ
ncbi:MAG: Bro-N domain-containing protein, partial [Candidatus Fonsibacter sp.]